MAASETLFYLFQKKHCNINAVIAFYMSFYFAAWFSFNGFISFPHGFPKQNTLNKIIWWIVHGFYNKRPQN